MDLRGYQLRSITSMFSMRTKYSVGTGISYSDHYPEKDIFERLMSRLRSIVPRGPNFVPVIEGAFR